MHRGISDVIERYAVRLGPITSQIRYLNATGRPIVVRDGGSNVRIEPLPADILDVTNANDIPELPFRPWPLGGDSGRVRYITHYRVAREHPLRTDLVIPVHQKVVDGVFEVRGFVPFLAYEQNLTIFDYVMCGLYQVHPIVWVDFFHAKECPVYNVFLPQASQKCCGADGPNVQSAGCFASVRWESPERRRDQPLKVKNMSVWDAASKLFEDHFGEEIMKAALTYPCEDCSSFSSTRVVGYTRWQSPQLEGDIEEASRFVEVVTLICRLCNCIRVVEACHRFICEN